MARKLAAAPGEQDLVREIIAAWQIQNPTMCRQLRKRGELAALALTQARLAQDYAETLIAPSGFGPVTAWSAAMRDALTLPS